MDYHPRNGPGLKPVKSVKMHSELTGEEGTDEKVTKFSGPLISH